MTEPHRLILPTIGLLALAAAIAAVAVAWLPEGVIRWVPTAVGALWTGAMVWFAHRLRDEPGVGSRSLRSGAVACGLLTLVAASFGMRQAIGWPEAALSIPAIVGLGVWARQTVRELRLRRRLPPAPPGPVLRLRDREPPRRSHWM